MKKHFNRQRIEICMAGPIRNIPNPLDQGPLGKRRERAFLMSDSRAGEIATKMGR